MSQHPGLTPVMHQEHPLARLIKALVQIGPKLKERIGRKSEPTSTPTFYIGL